MPRQNSLIKISGRMGNEVYYYRKDGKNRKNYLIRRTPETVSQTPATKRAAKDFGTASKSSSLIRKALHEYTRHCYDTTLHYRLNSRMLQAENMQSLQHFRFNSAAGIQTHAVIEKSDTGGINISFPDALHNTTTTHIAIKAIALSVNFKKGTSQQVESNTVMIKRGEKPTPLTININRRNLTLIILQIQSLFEVNGQWYISQNKKGNALDVISVLSPVEKPKEKKFRNKAPHFWLPYAAPANRPLIIAPVNYSSLPEG